MEDIKVFIASSESSIGVADLVADRLQKTSNVKVRVWDEGVFTLNQGVLDRLLNVIDEFDFAVMIWGPDDVMKSKGAAAASPRDNVIFESGLFMGRLGKDRVFIVCDSHGNVKIPSDFAGITLVHYDGSKVKEEGESAIRSASDKVAAEIAKRGVTELAGEWRSRYAMHGDLEHREVIDDLTISSAPHGIYINSLASTEPYSAHGCTVNKQQIIGEWRHKSGENFVEGTFMLLVGPRADVMYGYCTGQDEKGAMTFSTWVLARKTANEMEVTSLLNFGQKLLNDGTITLPVEVSSK